MQCIPCTSSAATKLYLRLCTVGFPGLTQSTSVETQLGNMCLVGSLPFATGWVSLAGTFQQSPKPTHIFYFRKMCKSGMCFMYSLCKDKVAACFWMPCCTIIVRVPTAMGNTVYCVESQRQPIALFVRLSKSFLLLLVTTSHWVIMAPSWSFLERGIIRYLNPMD